MRPIDGGRLLLLGAIWGSSYLLIKIGLEGFTFVQLVAIRVIVAAGALVAFARHRGLSLPREFGVWRALTVMALASNVIPFLLISWGEQSITSSLSAILNSTTPLFTALLAAALVDGEGLGAVRATGIALGFVGVVVVVGGDASGGSLGGQLAIVLSSLSYGVGLIVARKYLSARGQSPIVASTGQLVMASAIMLPPTIVDVVRAPPSFEPIATLSVVVLGLIGTGVAYLIYYRLVTDVGPTSTSFVTYLIPIFGAALGWVVLDERLGWNALVGATLVIGGIAVAERGGRRSADIGAGRTAPSTGPPRPDAGRGGARGPAGSLLENTGKRLL